MECLFSSPLGANLKRENAGHNPGPDCTAVEVSVRMGLERQFLPEHRSPASVEYVKGSPGLNAKIGDAEDCGVLCLAATIWHNLQAYFSVI